MVQQSVTKQQISEAIRALDLSDRPLCVHSSLRSFGGLEEGPQTVIDGLLAEGCTIIVPSFTSEFEVPPPVDRRIPHNGYDYDADLPPRTMILRWYAPESQAIDSDMGALPAAIVATAGRVRGNHPDDSFCAIGPLAPDLIQGQQPTSVYAPLAALAKMGGWVVLMGVALDRLTLIHYAEERAGRRLFRRWSRDRDGLLIESQIGSCSSGFERLRDVLAPIERTIEVGTSRWRAYPAAELVELAAYAILENPAITHCDDPNCLRCNDAVLGGPLGVQDALP